MTPNFYITTLLKLLQTKFFFRFRAVNIENHIASIIYPNSAKYRITIEADCGYIKEYSIVDNLGRDISSTISTYPRSSELTRVFDLSFLPGGVYYFISSESKQKIIRL